MKKMYIIGIAILVIMVSIGIYVFVGEDNITDWIENNQFQLSYIINNPELKMDLILRVFIDREKAEMESIHHLWEQAATYQRELKEMFGINFPNSPRVDKPFILEGWDGPPPYRRDFDTKKYSEETYFPREGRTTNDPSDYMKQKLYPNE